METPFKPTHTLDLLKTAPLSRASWHALTRGGAQTTVAVEVRETENGESVVRAMRDEQEYVFRAPVEALTEIHTAGPKARECGHCGGPLTSPSPARIGCEKCGWTAPLPVTPERTSRDDEPTAQLGPPKPTPTVPAPPKAPDDPESR